MSLDSDVPSTTPATDAHTPTPNDPPTAPDQPSATSVAELADRITALATSLASREADLMDLVAKFDAAEGFAHYEGIVSTAHWLAWQCALSDGTAREHVRVARALPAMPHTRELFRQGSLSYSKVRELTRLVGEVDEAELADFALLTTASQLARTVRAFRLPPGSRLPQEVDRELRWHTTPNDMERLTVTLPREEAAVIKTALESALQQLLHDRSPDAQPDDTHGTLDDGSDGLTPDPDDTTRPNEPSEPVARVTDAERVQALVDLANCYLADRDHRPADDHTLVMVHVAAEQLDPALAVSSPPTAEAKVAAPSGADIPAGTPARAADQVGERATSVAEVPAEPSSHGTDQPGEQGAVLNPDVPAGTPAVSAQLVEELRRRVCHIPSVGAISAATVQRLACSDRVQGVIQDAAGHILDLGRSRRLVSPAQRRALAARDHHTCQFPGCRQHHRLDAHHIIPWAAGGPTDLDNLILICRRHHTLIHEGGLRIVRSTIPIPGHRFRFHRADGSPIQPAPASTDPNWEWHHDLMSEIGVGFRRQLFSPVPAHGGRHDGQAPDRQSAAAATGTRLLRLPKDLTRPVGDIRTRGGGEGFSLHECVRVLHELRLPVDPEGDGTVVAAA